jgi:hypothetical protein
MELESGERKLGLRRLAERRRHGEGVGEGRGGERREEKEEAGR